MQLPLHAEAPCSTASREVAWEEELDEWEVLVAELRMRRQAAGEREANKARARVAH